MKLARRQFRGSQSAESGTRHGGRAQGQAEAYFFIRTCSDHASSPCPCPRHSFTCQNRESCSDANHQLVFFSHMRMQQCSTCAASLHLLISHHLEIEFRIGLGGTEEEREKERKRESRWHDEMAHRPSGECGERNLPCDSAVSPITALAS